MRLIFCVEMPLVITIIPGILTIFCHVGLNLQFSSQQEPCLRCRNLSRTAISTVPVVSNVLRTSTHCIHGEADTFTHDVGSAWRNIRARVPHYVLQKHIASILMTDCISQGLLKIWEHCSPVTLPSGMYHNITAIPRSAHKLS